MSLTSRGLLTKIYDSDKKPTLKTIKQKSTLGNEAIGHIKKKKKKKILYTTIKEKENDGDDNKANNNNIKKNSNKILIKNIFKDKINKFPIIPQLNIINNNKISNEINFMKSTQNTIDENNETKTKPEILQKDTYLNYKMIESTSEDIEHPLRELKKGLNGAGWLSTRFCQYPQYIYVQFSQPVLIKKIEIVLHETNIPSLIKFYTYIPKSKDDFIANYKHVNYDYIGFIRTDSNERSNFQSRESRKVYIESKALFFKIELDKNYFNNFNVFNQVGLLKLEFFGDYLQYIGGNQNNNQLVLKHAMKTNFFNDSDLETICGRQLTELKRQMKYNIEIENYMECKEIKNKIEKIRLYGKRIFDLESEKNIAINNEDFSKAIELKNLVDKMKINLQNIDSSLNSPRILSQRDSKESQALKIKKFSNIDLTNNNNNNNNNNNLTEEKENLIEIEDQKNDLNNNNENKEENNNENNNNKNEINENKEENNK